MFARLASLAVLALAIGARADLVVSTPGSITQVSKALFFLYFWPLSALAPKDFFDRVSTGAEMASLSFASS